MERTLKAKYSTKENRKEILDNRDQILENCDRIKNVEKCVGEIGDHIQHTNDVIEPLVFEHKQLLSGKDGLITQFAIVKTSLDKIESGTNKVLWAIILAVIGAVLKLIFIP